MQMHISYKRSFYAYVHFYTKPTYLHKVHRSQRKQEKNRKK